MTRTTVDLCCHLAIVYGGRDSGGGGACGRRWSIEEVNFHFPVMDDDLLGNRFHDLPLVLME